MSNSIKITGNNIFTTASAGSSKPLLKPEIRKALDELKKAMGIPTDGN